MKQAVDLSHHNGSVNFENLRAAGIDCVILQAGYGMMEYQKDPCFEEYYSKANRAGLKIGAYLYSYAVDVHQAKREAEVCLKWIRGKSFDMPVYIDMEEENLTYLGRDTLTKMAVTFCEIIEKNGYSAGVYANANWFTNWLDYDSIRQKYSIWLAQYASQKAFDCDIWQYSDCGRISGETCDFDMNHVYNIPKKTVTFKKNAGLYKYAYIDTLGGTSTKLKTAPKGSNAEWISDDGFGWSKVKVGGKVYYAVNSRLNKKGLSAYPKAKLTVSTAVFKADKNGLGERKLLKKGKTVKILCNIEKGKYKNFKLISYMGTKYYLP